MKLKSVALVVVACGLLTGFNPGYASAVLSTRLQGLQQEYGRYKQNNPGQRFVSKDSSVYVQPQDSVLVDLITAADSVQDIIGQLQALGMTRIHHYRNTISGIVPIAQLGNLEQIAGVGAVRSTRPLSHGSGIAFNQADPAQFSDVVKKRYDVDGSGLKIGVLSDSYDCLGGAEADIASGDLPPEVTVLAELPDCEAGSDEGRAMLQLIHDIAPGARLSFHSAFLGEAGFAEGIIKLAQDGADIIVDDVGYALEPMFQDGIIAQAIDQVKHNGVAYFSSAGNDARLSYEAFFNPGIEPVSGDNAHNFAAAGQQPDFYQKITVPVNALLRLVLQWDDPARSAGGEGARTDLDVFLFDAQHKRILASGTESNIDHDPSEFVVFLNDEALNFGTEFNVYISHRAGPRPNYIKYMFFGGIPSPWPEQLPTEPIDTPFFMSIDEYPTHSGTILGHPNARGAMAIGAMPYQETPWFRQPIKQAKIESFSSAGGVPTLFDTEGRRLAQYELRQKPDIVAVDDVNTTFFPELSETTDTDADGLPNFSGTSAAAPNAAAVAALLLQKFPHLTPDALYQTMRDAALDLNDPFTSSDDTGFDWGTGFGLLKADFLFNTVDRDGVHLTLTASTARVKAGEAFNYQFDLANLSNKNLSNVRIRALRLPAHVNFLGIDGCADIDPVEVSCRLDNVNAGETRTVNIQVMPVNNPTGRLLFDADVLTATPVDLSTAAVNLDIPLQALMGDLNLDGCVDISDWGILFGVFRAGTSSPEFDLTGDGGVGLDDLTALENAYSRPPAGGACN